MHDGQRRTFDLQPTELLADLGTAWSSAGYRRAPGVDNATTAAVYPAMEIADAEPVRFRALMP